MRTLAESGFLSRYANHMSYVIVILKKYYVIYYTCSKIRLTENVFLLTPD